MNAYLPVVFDFQRAGRSFAATISNWWIRNAQTHSAKNAYARKNQNLHDIDRDTRADIGIDVSEASLRLESFHPRIVAVDVLSRTCQFG